MQRMHNFRKKEIVKYGVHEHVQPVIVHCWNDGKRSAEKPRAWNNSWRAVCTAV